MRFRVISQAIWAGCQRPKNKTTANILFSFSVLTIEIEGVPSNLLVSGESTFCDSDHLTQPISKSCSEWNKSNGRVHIYAFMAFVKYIYSNSIAQVCVCVKWDSWERPAFDITAKKQGVEYKGRQQLASYAPLKKNKSHLYEKKRPAKTKLSLRC